jgi:hypothetical protein
VAVDQLTLQEVAKEPGVALVDLPLGMHLGCEDLHHVAETPA